jgi:hypothetical protein
VIATFIGSQDINLRVQERGQFYRCVFFPSDPFACQTPNDLRLPRLPFGIMTPNARHGTTFKKHGCADAEPVMYGEFFDVKDNARSHGQSIKCS